MTDNTDLSYSHQNKSWEDRKFYSDREDISSFSQKNNLWERETSLAPFWIGLLWGGLFASTAVISAIAGASLTQFDLVSSTVGNFLVAYNSQKSFLSSSSTESSTIPHITRPVNLLLLGKNQSDKSDGITIFLIEFKPKDNFVKITSIPQERQVEIPEIGLGTIQAAYENGGIETVTQVINNTIDDGKIDRYIEANPTTLLKLVDLLGGVEVFIPQQSQAKTIVKSSPGWQTLDGKQTIEHLLQDSSNDQFRQVQQQQMLIEAVRQRLHQPNFADNLTEIAQILPNYFVSDLSLLEMESLLSFLHQLERNDVAVKILPNYEPKPKSPSENFVTSIDGDKDTRTRENTAYSGYVSRNMPIAIQNTTNNPQLSLQVLEYLIAKGFYNVYLDRHISIDLNQTEIIAPANNLEAANHLQQVLNIGKLEISPVEHTDSELTVRIGEDAKFIFLDNSLIK